MEQLVTALRLEEPARFNPDRLERLCDEIGEVRAEHEVARALEVINIRIRALARLDPCDRRNDLATPIRVLVATSDRIGMATLAWVGRDVLTSLEQRDTVALAATFARLIRVGERSLHSIWDLEDVSG